MKELSGVVSTLPVTTAQTVDLHMKALLSKGRDVISFCVGEPDFDTPEFISEAGSRAIAEGKTKYTNASGMPSLREAVALSMRRDYGVTYAPDEIAITTGAKYAVYAAVRAIVNPGDEVILPAPYWTSYYHIIRLAGAMPVLVPCLPKNGWKPQPAQLRRAVTERTKACILNNPNNPTGAAYSRAELTELSRVFQENDLYVISDEIYARLLYTDEPFCPAASVSDDMRARTVTINGVSKAYAMTGWRIGYAAGSRTVIKAISAFLSHTTGSPNTMAQIAATQALLGAQDDTERMRKAYQSRRDCMASALSEMDGVRFTVPNGAFYILLDIRELLNDRFTDEADFALQLLEAEGVATVPCADFGAPGHIRLCYTLPEECITEGVRRMKRFIGEGRRI